MNVCLLWMAECYWMALWLIWEKKMFSSCCNLYFFRILPFFRLFVREKWIEMYKILFETKVTMEYSIKSCIHFYLLLPRCISNDNSSWINHFYHKICKNVLRMLDHSTVNEQWKIKLILEVKSTKMVFVWMK